MANISDEQIVMVYKCYTTRSIIINIYSLSEIRNINDFNAGVAFKVIFIDHPILILYYTPIHVTFTVVQHIILC